VVQNFSKALKIGFISFNLSTLDKGCLALTKSLRFVDRQMNRAQPISLAFYSSNDSWKVLDENVRIYNSLYQGCSN